ncbi:hypothetical protein GQ44DRAFT_828424 [Phaeosphaeriaceae sp. PMI808]|nr:hypothetical protein GQ44DRAFT_828424 [Phaeosphaeriaceae sp. PMI808]
MDSHQGAGFTFDMNMDFSNVFATKPIEGETSTSFFFGDEGIDTTTSIMDPILFPQQTAFDMQQSLTLDNTSGSTSVWNGQLTPQSQNTLNTFPSTPTHSFDSLYQQPQYGSALGKRPLQLDAQDFPQSKRHETLGDFTTASMFSPLIPSTTASSWTLDTQHTPATSVELGLSDEAADMCAMWFNKYAILPSDRHIDSLSQLTGESAEAIRHWFGRLMKQGMGSGHGDSAYRSQTALPLVDEFWNEYSTGAIEVPQLPLDESTQESITTPDINCAHEAVTVSQSANALRGGKKSRCAPTDDQSLLSRDPNKIYQCTRKCGKRYGRKCDWKRNEEEGYPCKSWVCSLCTSEGVDNVKPCFRKYHFAQHFRNIHPGENCDDYEEASIFSSETEFPRKCGFCKHRFESRQERIDHIAVHFKQGKCMLDWNDDENAHDSDNTDNDDDQSGGDDGSNDSSPPSQPPDHYPRVDLIPRNTVVATTQMAATAAVVPKAASSSSNFHNSTKGRLVVTHHPPRQQPKGDNTKTLAGNAISGTLTQNLVDFSLRKTRRDYSKYCESMGFDLLDNKTVQTDRGVRSDITLPSSSLSTERRSIQTSALKSVIQREPKITSSCGIGNSAQMLVIEQLPQSISTSSQSFLSVRFLGAGGFSTVDEVVHRGTNLRLGRKTLKNRDPVAIKELWKEVDILQKLRHPHVIRLLGAYSNGDKMSMLLSPIADTTLALWLDRFSGTKPENLSQVVTKMLGCLASSVRYLHEQRPFIKHMDIKPQNILIVEGDGEFPHVVLCDFGISSSEDIAENQVAAPLTRQYTAPEVFEGFARQRAADIWSLGCVFMEMASVSFSQGNSSWLGLRKEFSGRTSKYYWQDVPGLQDRLTVLLEEAASATEQLVVQTLKKMLRPQPAERPDAAALTLVFTPAPCCLSWPNDKASYPGPREELSSVDMLVNGHGADCSVKLHEHDEAIVKTSQGRAKSWVEECSHTHEACSHLALNNSKTLPTRLLSICYDGTDELYLRLVDSASFGTHVEAVEYIALSHMWDQTHTTLSTENLQALQTNVSTQELSPALNAAIITAQGLGYRYVWVDSLCVLQDSDDDKRQECANMASVFRNAALTVIMDQVDDGLDQFKDKLSRNNEQDLESMAFGFASWETHVLGVQLAQGIGDLPQGLPSLIWEKAHSRIELTEGLQPRAVDQHTPKLDKYVTLDHPTPLDPRRIRNCQWIKKEGDGIGDSMQAAQTTLQVENAIALPTKAYELFSTPTQANNRAVSKLCATSTSCGDNSPFELVENVWELAIDVDTASARQGIEKSGQLDQHGSRNAVGGRNVDHDDAMIDIDTGTQGLV